MQEQEYDVIVVGAGPAGSTAARVAAAAGLKVLILERKARPGFPVQCAEYVPTLMDLEVEIPREAVAQRIEGMEARFPEGTTLTVHAPGFLLRREVFDYTLARQAVVAGAELWTATCALGWTEKGLIVHREGSLLTLKARVVVGADGPRSVVARDAGYRPHRLAVAYQVEVELPEPMRVTRVYFDPAFFGGYAWVFPKGLTANVGVGVTGGGADRRWPDLRGLLIKFLSFLGWEKRRVVRRTGGFIPVSGPYQSCCLERVILCGDAGGFTHPVTGAGILFAVQSGEMAGRATVRYFREATPLSSYDEEWREFLGPPLLRAVRQRRRMEAGWTGEAQALTTLLREAWQM